MNPSEAAGQAIRCADRQLLGEALQASRRDTLAAFDCWERGLSAQGLVVPQRADLNPPLWELGHIGWFQEYWIARNPERARGQAADPEAPRGRSVRANADALFDSGKVPHDSRWSLPLPDTNTARLELAEQLGATLQLLRTAGSDDEALYFFRLALLHEDMHHEAALYMAQALGLPMDQYRWQPAPLQGPRRSLELGAGRFRLGSAGNGFAFDNELQACEVDVAAFTIDSRAVCWQEFLPFLEDGGYAQPRWWSAAGRQWLATERPVAPRYLRRDGAQWQQWCFGQWHPLGGQLPVCHVNRYEAEAWCAWAGRRLPTEAEWECAALAHPADFAWGAVWEWTSSTFGPYPGFVAHPYRDYSAPWFGTRAVLRGASFATQDRMHHVRYRNFFTPERRDIFGGFRSCCA